MKSLRQVQEIVFAHGNVGSTETFDLANGNVHTATMDASCTFTFTGAVTGYACTLTLILTQSGAGSFAATWPTGSKYPGGTDVVLSLPTGSVDIITCITIDGGTTWHIFPAGLAMAT